MNLANLQRLHDRIKTTRVFHMHVYAVRGNLSYARAVREAEYGNIEENPGCGTPMCLAGHAAWIAVHEDKVSAECCTTREIATAWLDIGSDQASSLFMNHLAFCEQSNCWTNRGWMGTGVDFSAIGIKRRDFVLNRLEIILKTGSFEAALGTEEELLARATLQSIAKDRPA